jgi:hypothetical protein
MTDAIVDVLPRTPEPAIEAQDAGTSAAAYAGTPSSPWPAVLQATGTRYAALLSDTHPQWLESWLPTALSPPAPLPAAHELQLVQLLLKRLGVQWPKLSRWHCKLHRIRLLPRKDAERVFALIALFTHPDLLAHTIDGERRRAIRQFVGPQACDALLADLRAPALPTPNQKLIRTLDGLVDWGVHIVGSAILDEDQDVVKLMRLYLPVHTALYRPLSTPQRARARTVCDEFFERSQDLVPDLSWLFGSNSAA